VITLAAVLPIVAEALPRVVGGAFLAAAVPAPLEQAVTGGAVFSHIGCSNVSIKEAVWSDAQTKGNIVKTTRALKLHILKQNAFPPCSFLGVGVKSISMVFVLRKFPSSLKALQIPLPHPLAQPSEGLFVKTAKGHKVLSVQFGRGDVGEDVLLKNAMAVTRAVRKNLDARLVREITVNVDRLALPVWSRKLWDRRKQKLFTMSGSRNEAKKGSMAPPAGLPWKMARIS